MCVVCLSVSVCARVCGVSVCVYLSDVTVCVVCGVSVFAIVHKGQLSGVVLSVNHVKAGSLLFLHFILQTQSAFLASGALSPVCASHLALYWDYRYVPPHPTFYVSSGY